MFARTLSARPKLPRFRLALVGAISLLGVLLLWHQIQHISLRAVHDNFAQIAGWQWALACVASAASFAALGQYDALWHRALNTGVSAQTARRTGMMAIAIGQTLGLAAFVAGLVRWHRLPGLAPATILKLSAAVSLSFTLCWAILALPAVWWLIGADHPAAPPLGLVGLILLAMVFAGRRICKRHGIAPAMAIGMLFWTSLDMTFAALILFAVLPETNAPGTLIAAVIVATGAGLISNAPGGVGTFDLALIALLPGVPVESLISALLAYRLCYFLTPFTIAAACLVRKPIGRVSAPPQAPALWSLAAQTGQIMGQSTWAAFMGQTALGPIAIGAPIGPVAQWSRMIGAVYKCDARTAQQLRTQGWRVARIASEARLNPQHFDTSGSAFQSLRRKLRKAESAAITIHARQPRMDEAADVAQRWSRAHGGELGFSMGRFSPTLIADQRVFLIVQNDALQGFITFHTAPSGWALDLMRYVPGLPDGAMQAAVIAALRTARDEGITSLCLGAVPCFQGRLARLDASRSGLVQFKRSFAPGWHPVYHAARNPIWFALTGLAITWAIQRPLANLRHQPLIIKIMQRIQLRPARARGIAGSITKGRAPDDKCTDSPA